MESELANQFVAIDIMHNLHLGTSKRIFFGIWVEKGIITRHHLLLIDELASKFTVPSNIARLCHLIMQVLKLLNRLLGQQSIFLSF